MGELDSPQSHPIGGGKASKQVSSGSRSSFHGFCAERKLLFLLGLRVERNEPAIVLYRWCDLRRVQYYEALDYAEVTARTDKEAVKWPP